MDTSYPTLYPLDQSYSAISAQAKKENEGKDREA